MQRRVQGRKESRRQFTRTAMKVHPKNMQSSASARFTMRGGVRM